MSSVRTNAERLLALGERNRAKRKSLDVRIRENSIADTNGCWIWQRKIDKDGYGHIAIPTGSGSSRDVRAHRVSYETFVGPIPDDLTIDHTCYVPACVNPSHLRPLTLSKNVSEARARKTHCKHGHEFTPENTFRKPNGGRGCRTCQRRSVSEYRARKLVAA